MQWFLLTALTAGMTLAADAVPDGADTIQGKWRLESVIAEGQDVSDGLKDAKATIQDDQFELLLANGTKIVRTLKVDTSVNPHCIDFTDENKQVLEGIYVLDAESLKMCLYSGGDRQRPLEFSSKANSGHILLMLKRVK